MENVKDPTEVEGRRALEAVSGEALITDELRVRIQDTLDEIASLTEDATALRQRVEDLYPRLVALDNEHVQLLGTRFPDGVPDFPDVIGAFDKLSGNHQVFHGFHDLLREMHNTLCRDYPHETRDDAEEVREIWRQTFSPTPSRFQR